ncbi:hypothetical protein P691DRAFT_805281 [Macrolepiota fuliginosa MF-IS2]|uniref:Uncharacterized protein n=1 Tax=Macrolepiota fuliginosa MF-IS2 TaxID=1400762 RepID=A0A9P5X6G2_9AGAR|nr:hypothetical protein P691DRAFT_805281 [Macrolepiota fuliginosa MF-IS2]
MKLGQEAFSKVPEANPPPVTDEASLRTALTTYGAKEFRNQFSFDYQQRPPESQDPSMFFKSFNSLSYFEDMDTTDVDPYLTTSILSMVPLPDWVQVNALKDMGNDYRQIIVGQEKGNWRNVKVDRTYSRPGESLNPVVCKGMIVYYTDTRVTDQQITVSIAWVFFLGVYYEVLNHAALVRIDLLKNLCDNLVNVMKNPDTSVSTLPDKTRLTILLGRYARDEFYNNFGYELMDQATSPINRVPETPLYTIEQTGEFESWDDQKIQDWVDTILTPSDFPPLEQISGIRQDLIDSTKYKLQGQNDAGLNTWNVNDYSKTYGYDGETTIKVAGTFVHCNGTLTTGEDTVKISFVQFSGVFFNSEDPW